MDLEQVHPRMAIGPVTSGRRSLTGHRAHKKDRRQGQNPGHSSSLTADSFDQF